MMQLLEFGTIWFWILLLVASGLIIYSTEDDESNYAANIWFVCALLALYFLGNSETFKAIGSYMVHNPGPSLLIFGAYIFLGTVWSIFKWFFYLKGIRGRYENAYSFNIENYKVKENKARITHWMIYWPFSAIWTLINDPVKKSFEFVLSQFGGLYDKMSEKILGDLKKK
jgi:hypothetical protein